MNLPYLSLLIFVPLAGAVLVLFLNEKQHATIRTVATFIAAIPVVLVGMMWAQWDYSAVGMQFTEYHEWIPSLGVAYRLGVDGMSFAMLALTAFIGLIAVIASYGIEKRVKDYYALLLLLLAGINGVFAALDYVLFYVFWELVLVPMYFLIGIWGGPRREYAAIKFFIYTMVGSVIMLVGILALYLQTGAQTFGILELQQLGAELPSNWQWGIFLAMFIGFAVKVPIVPLHTWLPDAHVEAPTPISVILAAVLLKMGTYGFLRISHPTFPEIAQSFAYVLAILGVINLIYGALAAMAQDDMKKLVAYSSVSHMGYTLLGLAAATVTAVNGVVYQMVSHGLISAMLFLMVGVIYDRTHTRDMRKLGGFYITMPIAGGILAFAAFANLGLPGLSGFIAEFFVLLGAYAVYPNLVYISLIGLVLTAAFNLWMLQKVLMGQPKLEWEGLPDINRRELITLVPLMALTLLFGLVPSILMNLINTPVSELVARLGGM